MFLEEVDWCETSSTSLSMLGVGDQFISQGGLDQQSDAGILLWCQYLQLLSRR